MGEKEEKYRLYKEWSISVYGKLPFRWREKIISKHYGWMGQIKKMKVYHGLWNTYTGHSNNPLYIKYISEVYRAHQEGKEYMKL